MTRIAITNAAYEAIRRTMAKEARPRASLAGGGMTAVWLPRAVLEALTAARGPSETYSDVIIRIAKAERDQ